MSLVGSVHPIIEQIELTPRAGPDAVPHDPGHTHASGRMLWRTADDLFLIVIVPTLCAFLYLFQLTTPYFASQAQFVIRTNVNSTLGGLESLVQSEGLSRATDDSYVTLEYIRSRDLVRDLAAHSRLAELFGRPEADVFTRYPPLLSDGSFEELYRHYQHWIHADLDEGTGIVTLTAFAYRGDDAETFLTALIDHAEQLINRLNARAHDDAVRYATAFVDQEKRKVYDVEHQLTAFRNRSGTVDPANEANALLETIGHLNTDVAELEASFQQQNVLMPRNPTTANLRQRIASYHFEIEKLRGQIAGGDHSEASRLEVFDVLMLERELAAKTLEAAVANLNRANQESQANHVYLEQITHPNVPDAPERLPRLITFLGVCVISVSLWSIIRSVKRATARR